MTLTKDSIYELINAPTNVMKQHFVEYFSGDALDTFRWSTHATGSGTEEFVMSDSIDGGLLIKSRPNGAATLDFGPSDADKKRPFSPTGAVMILTSIMIEAQYSVQYNEFRTNFYTEAGKYVRMNIQGTTDGNSFDNKIKLMSNNPSVNTDTGIASSAIHNWHTYKLELLSSSSTLSVDGVLSSTGFGTISANPDAQCMPSLVSSATEGTVSAGAQSHYRYLECYNT